MSNDVYHEGMYTHKSGKTYHVCWYYDYDMGAPQTEGDGYGVTERMDWNPTHEEQLEQHLLDYEPELEEETRLRMMRALSRSTSWRDGDGLYYDVLSSLHLARTEWGFDDPVKAMEVVEKDFAYLKGWYDDDWHWLTVSVAPLDEDGEPMEDHREYCGGYESTIVHDDEYKCDRDSAIGDLIHSVEYVLKRELHKDQMELDLTS